MTTFLSAHDVCRIVREVGFERLWLRLVDYLEQDFSRWDSFDRTPRMASHNPKGVIELMPIADAETFGFKYVNGHPANPALGLQTVVAFGALADVATGYPLLLADLTLATAFRTAATSALAARLLARPEPRTMALIGAGAQSEFQASAFKTVLGVDQLRVFDPDPEAVRKFVRNLARENFQIEHCANAQEAVIGADIVTTITADKRKATILSGNMVGAGVHVNAVGGDCPGKTELSRDLLLRSEIFVEFAPQTRIEGEIQQLAADHPVTELWEVVAGRKPGRRRAAETTVFDSVGFALEDFSVMRLLRELAEEMGAGQEIALVAAPSDPKDLFGLIHARQRDAELA
jgi:ornithine cyclodeaminase